MKVTRRLRARVNDVALSCDRVFEAGVLYHRQVDTCHIDILETISRLPVDNAYNSQLRQHCRASTRPSAG